MEKIVGWREWLTLPELGIKRLKCKVDTGAKNSALHSFEIIEFLKDDEQWIRFGIHIDEENPELVQYCESKVIDIRDVTDSGGNITSRYFIETEIEIGQSRLRVQMSLTSRDTMKFKMLLGRTALKKAGFIVNPSKSFLQGTIE